MKQNDRYTPSTLEDALYCTDAEIRIALRFNTWYGQPCCDVFTTVTTSAGADESFTVVDVPPATVSHVMQRNAEALDKALRLMVADFRAMSDAMQRRHVTTVSELKRKMKEAGGADSSCV